MKFNKFAVFIVLALLLLGLFTTVQPAEADAPGPSDPGGVVPVLHDDLPNNNACEILGYDFETKIDSPVVPGTYSLNGDPVNKVTISSDDGVYWTWSSTLGIDAVVMKGGTPANVYFYDPESTGDGHLHSPENASGEPAELSHISFCYDYEVDVSKTAETSLTRTFDWTITKEADATYNLFEGDTQDHKYTVSVNKDDGTDSNWAVAGAITIENNTPFDATIESVDDVVSKMGEVDIAAAVSCPETLPHTLAPGKSLACSYGSTALPDGSDRLNTATVTTSGTVRGGGATTGVLFDGDTTINKVNDSVSVTDTNSAFGGPKNVSDDATWDYEIEFACDANEGTLVNTAKVIGDENKELDSDTATVTINCYDLTVEKDADTSLIRTWDWEITKEADATYNLFEGDTQDHKYTISVDKTGSTDSDWAVSGDINVINNTPIDAEITGVADVLPGSSNLSVNCGVTFPHTLPAGQTLTCSYSADLPNADTRTNTGTGTLQNYDYASDGTATKGGTTNYSGDATVDFSGATVTEVNDEVTITDTNSDFGGDKTVSGSDSWMYESEFACDADAGSHINTAKVLGDDNAELDSDTATVTINCYDLTVTKDADTSLTRSWDWTITKEADQTELLLASGQAPVLVNYSVTVDASSTDSDWAVSGDINVINNTPIDAEITGVADVLPGSSNLSVNCGVTFPHTLPAGQTLTCSYSADLPNADTRTNTGTGTLQNYDYASDGTATKGGTTDYSDDATVDFSGATVTEIDECIDVTDDKKGGLGSVCADQAPATFNYSTSFGQHPEADVYLECGETIYTNIASYLVVDDENDTGETDSDNWAVTAIVECLDGCSLTPGYWKTHSQKGPAPYDDNWANLGDLEEDTIFFLSGQTYYEVLWTPPQGNAYYILAHAYIAAELNGLNGADTSAISDELEDAAALFETYSPDEVAALKGKNGKETRAEFISLAKTLDDYNNGFIGPGHCTE